MSIVAGRNIYIEKWGHRDCDLRDSGLKPEHAWRVTHDWEVPLEKDEKSGRWHVTEDAAKELGEGSVLLE